MKNITVYCASAANLAPVYIEAARELGREIVAAGAGAVTGGGRTGLMGAVADAVLGAGGSITGIIPQFMHEKGWHHSGLTELRIVADMHERKRTMASLATGCIALPGGIGTFEELTEIITWRVLGLYKGNVVIYNVNDYYAPLLAQLGSAIEQGFMRPDHEGLFSVATSAREAVEMALDPNPRTDFSAKFK